MNTVQLTKNGLTNPEVLELRQKYGLNELKNKGIRWYHILLRQFSSPFIYLLIFAALLAIFLGESIDGIVILIFVLINSGLGFYQEYKSEEALKILRNYISSKIRVVRNSTVELIDSRELVPGDTVVLNPGDKIPADIRFIETTDLNVDESILTGESASVKKTVDSFGFSGTIIAAGGGKGIVLKIGNETRMGKISKLTVETKHISSFEKGISQFSGYILGLIIVTLIAVFAANLIIKGSQIDIFELILFSIALAVSVIPEALPVVITFSLSHGALKLAKNKVVVKRLSAIEDLGGIEILCSDKTGTITENKLSVEDIFPVNNGLTILYGALASAQKIKKDDRLDSFDEAIWNMFFQTSSLKKDKINGFTKIKEVPFDPKRKRNSVFLRENEKYLLVVRGAPEEIIKISNSDTTLKKTVQDWTEKKGTEGKRVLAIGIKKIKTDKINPLHEESNLEFIGCISFTDPLKPTAHEAIKKAEELGVEIKILTGDSKEVATSIAFQVGLIKEKNKVITGEDFFQQTNENQYLSVNNYDVFARVSPEEKFKIIKLLQKHKEVGFLGEGINDAPALKIANVALVVASASNLARDTADIILLHKSLRVIIDGIRLGRETFSNTNKYIKATLSSNLGNFYTVAITSLFVSYLPMLPLQILLINLLTDFPMISIARDAIETEDLKRPKSYDIKEIAFVAILLGVVSSFFDFMFFIFYSRISPSVLHTNWFMGSVLTELVFLFSIRTKLPFYKAKKMSKPIFILSVFAALTAILLPFTYFGRHIFSFVQPTYSMLLINVSIVIIYLLVTDFVKVIYYRSSFYKKAAI